MLDHLAEIIGEASVEQIKQTLQGFKHLAKNWYITMGGFLFLTFVSTTLFAVIRDSLNQLWSIKAHPSPAFKTTLLPRLKAVAVILISGLLFVGVLFGEAI
ncbi:hypothetical protein, partial [Streptobacillus moniliformis]|uniref:hypothetical protein n=1 Tax=Streptobacillus moniliformis TaxID=34105 RepID=UPI001E4FF545